MAAGTSTITYTVIGSGGCADAKATRTVTVTAAPNAGTISGTQALCSNGTTTFTSNGTLGGTWTSSDTSKATINALTGGITPVAGGTSTITYTVIGLGGCADTKATRTVTVTAAPNAGTISGTQALCSNGTTTFISNGASGGTWTSSDISKATINALTGVITTVAGGTSTITYTVIGSEGCADAKATRTVTVTAAPNAPTGSASQSLALNSTLNSIVVSGTDILWYSSPTSTNPLINNTTPLINGTTYYASQTLNGCEGPRLAVIVQVQNLGIADFNTIKISYSPNPVTNVLDINSNEIIKNISIVNVLGQIVFTKKCNSTDLNIDLSSLTPGNYFVKVQAEEKKNVFKIIKK